MIAVIDYGVGNLFSISRSLEFLGLDCVVTSDPKVIDNAGKIILPGVGAFGDAAEKLKTLGLDEIVTAQTRKGKYLLGICLGMQLLFEESLEFGHNIGLGLLSGAIIPLKCEKYKIPHMGWNDLKVVKENYLIDMNAKPFVYFVHSFYAAVSECTIALTEYGGMEISAVVGRDNVLGTQFHPEKSGAAGLDILKRFGNL